VFAVIHPDTLYQEALAEIEALVAAKDYAGALRVYNNKGLMSRVASLFGFKPSDLKDYILRLVGAKSNEGLVRALRAGTPELTGIEK
jgi:hypothetical protein